MFDFLASCESNSDDDDDDSDEEDLKQEVNKFKKLLQQFRAFSVTSGSSSVIWLSGCSSILAAVAESCLLFFLYFYCLERERERER